MKKYKFYKNKRTKYHPSLETSSDNTVWNNMELTSSPTKKNRYIELKSNPNLKSSKKSYVRKYVRKDPIRTRGQVLDRFYLSKQDLIEIEDYLFKKMLV